MTGLFDTHCHLTHADFQTDLPDVLCRMRDAHVNHAAVIAYDVPSCDEVCDFAHRHEGMVAAVGIHPEYARELDATNLDHLRSLTADRAVRAIGEIGLDLHDVRNPSLDDQIIALQMQLDLAWETQLPVIFHVRKAHRQLLDILRDRRNRLTGGIIHCFSGSAEVAQEYLALGYCLAFGGALTYDNARKAVRAAAAVPLDRLLLETDAPYMPPEGHRGEKNEPGYLPLVVSRLSQIRGEDTEKIGRATTDNACRIFRMREEND